MAKVGDRFTKSDLVAHFLAEKEVPAVFELSGGMIAFLIDSVSQLGKTPIFSFRHEQAAGFAAEASTRIGGRTAVAMATSGPGVTNLVTAIASSYFDSVPTIFITGQVNQKERIISLTQRQNGFQELDAVALTKGITKYAVSIDSSSDLEIEMEKAWTIAHSGRPGPVLIDIPIDVQQEPIAKPFPKVGRANVEMGSRPTFKDPDFNRFKDLKNLLVNSKNPIILAGGGIRTSGSAEIFREVVNKLKIPVVYSLMGVDLLDSSSPFRVGMIGSYGNRWANRALSRADLVIALGTRMDIRQTGTDLESFRAGKQIFRVDVDSSELQGRLIAEINIEANLVDFLTALLDEEMHNNGSENMAIIEDERRAFPPSKEQSGKAPFKPDEIIDWISSVYGDSNGYIVDVGQHQMWAAQSISLSPGQRFITSGGLGAMGFSLPAAIGAALTQIGRWVTISGDGCSQLSLAEFQTVFQYQLPITMCIINNRQHGMVAQFQESHLENRFVTTRDGYTVPDFVRVGEAFGIKSLLFNSVEDLENHREFVDTWKSGPLLLEFIVSTEARALPKLGMGESMKDL